MSVLDNARRAYTLLRSGRPDTNTIAGQLLTIIRNNLEEGKLSPVLLDPRGGRDKAQMEAYLEELGRGQHGPSEGPQHEYQK